MPTPLQNFVPSIDELNLASLLLKTYSGRWNRPDTLSVDAAIGIFKQSGVSFKQLRDIWSIADTDGSGDLSKEQLTVVIRLTGWVQAGEVLDERLLGKVGPLPKIKGVPDVVTVPKIGALFHPISFDEVVEFKRKFLDSKPVNGTLQKRQVIEVYMGENPTLSFDEVFRIMQLVDDKSGVFGFKNFVQGLRIVRSPQSSLITSSLLLETYGILDDVDLSDKTLAEGIAELCDTESDMFDLEDINQHGDTHWSMISKSKCGINQSEKAQSSDQYDAEDTKKLLTGRHAGLPQAKKLPGSFHHTPLAPSSPAQPEPFESLTEKYQSPFETRPISLTPTLLLGLPSTRPLSLPTNRPKSSQDPSTNTTALRQYSCHDNKGQGARGFSQFEAANRPKTTFRMVSGTTNMVQDNTTEPLDFRICFLRASVRASEAAAAEAVQALSQTNDYLMESLASACEYETAATRASTEAQNLRQNVLSQERELVELRARLDDVESAQPHSWADVDMLDLMASARESEAAAAKAISEAQDLRQTVLNLEQEIVELRGRLGGHESVQALSWSNIDMLDFMTSACESEVAATSAIVEARNLRRTVRSRDQEIVELRARLKDMEMVQHRSECNIDIQDLHNGHEHLKFQVESIQYLMEQHLIHSSPCIPLSTNDDTMIAEKVRVPDKTLSMHGMQPPEPLHPIVTEMDGQSDITDSPPPFSSSSSSQPLPKYAPPSPCADTTQSPDEKTAENVSQIYCSLQIKGQHPEFDDGFEACTGRVHRHSNGLDGHSEWVSQRVIKLKKVLRKGSVKA